MTNGISDSQADALAAARSPYRRSPLRPPHGLYELLRWFEAAVLAELPDRLHQVALWHDHIELRDADGIYSTKGGGSVLGAHAWADAFRRYLEGSPFGQDRDGFYRFPLMAALAKLEGVRRWHLGSTEARPENAVLAAYLRDVARNAFSFGAVADRYGFGVIAATVTEVALERLYRAYRSEAPARVMEAA